MTERGEQQLSRSASRLQIGRSALQWQGATLQITLDEWTAPWPQRLRGRLTLRPHALPARAFALDEAGHHHWQPIAPLARMDVDLSAPRLRWQGDAYLDHNRGDRPLAQDFQSWQWSRARSPGGDAASARIDYDAQTRAGGARALHLRVEADGRLSALPPPSVAPLADTAWLLHRHGHRHALQHEQPRGQAADGGGPALVATLESGPFYARSLLQQADGSLAMHESLSLDRFDRRWVQLLLPFRMPRWT